MNDTLSTPDPARQVAEVRQIIADRHLHTCDVSLLRIRRVVEPPLPEPEPVETNDRGWPRLHESPPDERQV
ncbi:hypothetical protein [Kribbella sp. NPDC023855]|uniref:hypothetical protein n=1 Tax=Kribbella sp. NPDC023855 TaxID=3154698 RepID=UPI0033CEDBD1